MPRSESQSRWVHLDVELIVAESEKAFLLRIDNQDHWVPKSQISDPDDYAEGDTNCTISVTEWIAEQKGLGDE